MQNRLFADEHRFDPNQLDVGFVYVMTNPFIPGLVKVGKTNRTPSERSQELSSTGVPGQWIVEFSIFTPNCTALELAAHTVLGQQRVSSDREFFRVTVGDAREKIETLADSLSIKYPGWPDLEDVKRNLENKISSEKAESSKRYLESRNRDQIRKLEAEISRREEEERRAAVAERMRTAAKQIIDDRTQKIIKQNKIIDTNSVILLAMSFYLLQQDKVWGVGLMTLFFAFLSLKELRDEIDEAVKTRIAHNLPPIE
jgi:hypothetical protein